MPCAAVTFDISVFIHRIVGMLFEQLHAILGVEFRQQLEPHVHNCHRFAASATLIDLVHGHLLSPSHNEDPNYLARPRSAS